MELNLNFKTNTELNLLNEVELKAYLNPLKIKDLQDTCKV